MIDAHRCDEDCVCPDHGTVLFWSRSQQLHACQDATCRFAHGLESHPDHRPSWLDLLPQRSPSST